MVETDASNHALGCSLSQFHGKRHHPVGFHSPKHAPAERNYAIHDKERLAIVVAFLKWRHKLEGMEKPVTAYTDDQNLQYLVTTKVWTHRQIRWAQRLCGFNFKIVYRQGTKEAGRMLWVGSRSTAVRRELRITNNKFSDPSTTENWRSPLYGFQMRNSCNGNGGTR